MALKRHYERYLWERGANHVKTEWEQARKEEAEEKQRQYEEWLRGEVFLPMLIIYRQQSAARHSAQGKGVR